MTSKITSLFRSRSSRSPTFSSSSYDQGLAKLGGKKIQVDDRDSTYSVAFLAEGKEIVSGSYKGKIQRWNVEEGKEAGTHGWMSAGHAIVCNMAVSQDGKWLVSGTADGQVRVWKMKNHEKTVDLFFGGLIKVYAVDISSDGTMFATGSRDGFARVFSFPPITGKPLSSLKHEGNVVAVKFSPNGCFLATATWDFDSVRVYEPHSQEVIADFKVRVNSQLNQSLAWDEGEDSAKLFALSYNGEIHVLDVSTKTTLSKWSIHSTDQPRCIALAGNRTFIAASANSSVSFWDTTTHAQIGSVVQHQYDITSIAVSANFNLVLAGHSTITLVNLHRILSSSSPDNVPYVDDETPNSEGVDHEQELDEEKVQETPNRRIAVLERTVEELRSQLAKLQQEANERDSLLRAHELKHRCEVLYATGRTFEAASTTAEITNAMSEEIRTNELLMSWLYEFSDRCMSNLETMGDHALSAEKHHEALEAYSVAISLAQFASGGDGILTKWASTKLIRGSVDEALHAATKFTIQRSSIYRAVCDVLEQNGRVTEAIMSFQQMQVELPSSDPHERLQWQLDFQRRCAEKLEKLAGIAMDTQNYEEAVEYFSTILSLDGVDRSHILANRSKAHALMNSWTAALNDADEVVGLNPSSYQGYEQRYAALYGSDRHAEAVEAFNTMLLILGQSPASHTHQLYSDPRPSIQRIVRDTIRNMPRVLIDTTTGRLCDKTQQAEAFEALPIYNSLVLSMTTEVDHARISSAAREFYRYVMFSHTWEKDEPSLQRVSNISIYDLDESTTHSKLKDFCLLVRSLGFRWAWSDTCCVDKSSTMVLQESLVAMFAWYRSSTLTIVFLRGVSSESQLPGDLRRSLWNTRGWTYQEYVAAETVQFYTEDWQLYLGLNMENHKESPIVVSEMQQATGMSAQEIAVHQPGMNKVREKLYVASMRQTTLMEDTAYSLLGIFNAAMPVIYGEHDRAVGRFLEHVLAGSGDVTILAWTGCAGRYNSCLPVDLRVYSQLLPPHVPQPISGAEMDAMAIALHTSLPNLAHAIALHTRLNSLPSPFAVAGHLRLPGIVCSLDELRLDESLMPLRTYRATSPLFHDIEIQTTDDLTMERDFYLIHPWIRPLIDQESPQRRASQDDTRALRLVARLWQPFGALILESVSSVLYRRVATDSLVMVRFREDVSLTSLVENVHTVEIV